jgi:phosphoribosyl 1,2-cyclic phosphodiesterase
VLRFKSLGSGSSGNATLVEAPVAAGDAHRLLIDCGLGIKVLQQRLESAGVKVEQINALFITHEHSDHVGCALALALRYKIPVWMSRGTYEAIGSPDFNGLLQFARDSQDFMVGHMLVTPFTVPHDAREPLQLTCTARGVKLGVLTDLGHATAHVLNHLSASNGLVLECNHDPTLLDASSYPEFLKRRIAGQHGHLSNKAAADIARALHHPGLSHVVAAHLSVQNNHPETVQAILAQALSRRAEDIVVATDSHGCPWQSMG